MLIFKKIFIAELQEINQIIEIVKYADKLGMSSFDVGLSLLLDAAEIIIVICIVIALFKEKKIKGYKLEFLGIISQKAARLSGRLFSFPNTKQKA